MIIIELFGAVAILLWGVRMVRTGIERLFGADLRRIMARMAGNRFSALLAGAGMAACLQSSTAVIVMASGFAARGALLLVPGLALVLGADIGTSIAAQLLSYDVKFLSPIFLAIGLIVFLSASSKTVRNTGRVLIGLGFVLLALKLIAMNTAIFRSSEAVGGMMGVFENDTLLAIAVAMVITWLAHSSLAIVLLVVTLVSSSVIPLELGIVFILGANLGAAIPAVIMTLNEPVAAQRLTLGNLVFRLIGVLVFSALLAPITRLLLDTGIQHGQLVAVFHILFNTALAVMFLPVLPLVAKIVTYLKAGSDTDAENDEMRCLYLSPQDSNNPGKALSNVARETLRMANVVYSMLDQSLRAFDDCTEIDRIQKADDIVEFLHREATLYIANIKRDHMSEDDMHRSVEVFTLTMNLEHIGDIIDSNLAELARNLHKSKMSFSQEGRDELLQLHRMMVNNFQLSIDLFMSRDEDVALQLLAEKKAFRDLLFNATENHIDRLRKGVTESLETSRIHLDILRDFRRINSHIAATAYPILNQDQALSR
ncbi:Na/Pi cotransporter family protein [Sneathiella chinensis]|uniref:Na/Pi cotransporter family protein n=1 Tax=Sneathiella chinensis TaxID=349750 RepID=UPI00146C3313|nr:Na/Pi cotransporter family protein [Sneathiella chinensis]